MVFTAIQKLVGDAEYDGETVSVLLDDLTASAVKEGLIAEEDRERVADEAMGALMLPPSAVEAHFSEIYEHSPAEATEKIPVLPAPNAKYTFPSASCTVTAYFPSPTL